MLIQNSVSQMEAIVSFFFSSEKKVYYLQNHLTFSRNAHCGCQFGDSLCLVPLAGAPLEAFTEEWSLHLTIVLIARTLDSEHH